MVVVLTDYVLCVRHLREDGVILLLIALNDSTGIYSLSLGLTSSESCSLSSQLSSQGVMVVI